MNLGDALEDLIKGGVGSGIVGHTTSGKPVHEHKGSYGSPDFNAKFHHFTPAEHKEAADLHYRKEEDVMEDRDNAREAHDFSLPKEHEDKYEQTLAPMRKQREAHEKAAESKAKRSAADAKDDAKRMAYDKKHGTHAGERGTVKESKKSEGDDMNDIFKSMGITVGSAPSLVIDQTVKGEDPCWDGYKKVPGKKKYSGDSCVKKSEEEIAGTQFLRKGMGMTSRDRLDEQLSKGSIGIPITTILNVPVDVIDQIVPPKAKKTSSEGLKDTHGENFHNDNDKQVEEMVSNEEEIELSMHNEGVLFLKAMGERVPFPKEKKKDDKVPFPTEKSEKKKLDLVEWAKEEENEKDHKKSLVDALNDLTKGEDSLIEMKKEKTSPKLIANLHENSPGIAEKRRPAQVVDKAEPKDDRFKEYTEEWKKKNKEAKKSELDDLCDLIKGEDETEKGQGITKVDGKAWASKFKPAVEPKTEKAKKAFQFIKSAGQGGMVFDFGHKTGNPIADHATELLNRHGDPTQMQIAQYQETSYQKAIGEYVNKGEQVYMKQPSVFGNVNDEWKNQLEKPMDQQVKEAFQKGELDNADPSAPAVKNQFNKTELKLGGQVIKATSETDAFVIEMMKAQMDSERKTDGGFVADVGSGGRVSVTAGDPLPEMN